MLLTLTLRCSRTLADLEICAAWTEKSISKLEIFIAKFQLSVRIEAGFFRGFIEKLSVFKVS